MNKPSPSLRRLLAIFALAALPASLAAAPITHGSGPSRGQLSEEVIAERVLRFIDVDFLRFEDDLNARRTGAERVPFRVAEPVAVSYTLDRDGTREVLADGGTLWRLRATSPGAVFVSFMLSGVRLPAGAELRFYSVDRAWESGSYTAAINNAFGRFGSPAIPGESGVIELYVPAGAAFAPSLVVESVSHGYRDFNNFRSVPFRHGGDELTPAIEALGACEVDVNCPEGSGWQADKRAVARTYDGRFLCTGQLVNNARQDCKNYFLTANHCVSRSQTAAGMTFYWNYENTTCGGNNASTSQTTSGAAVRATHTSSDFTLLELNSAPPAAFNVYYAGFNRSAAAPASAVAIHHPTGAAKKISFENDPVEDGGNFSGGWGGTHWRIVGWDVGTTEGGSSGCGLWNSSHQVIGQLHGGTADCSGGWDEFGKLSSSWGLGLASWLDPDNSGAVSVNGKESSTCTGGGGGGCFPTGQSCSSNSQCCSNRCDKKTKVCK